MTLPVRASSAARLLRRPLVTAIAGLIMATQLTFPAAHATVDFGVEARPVAFTVRNVNRSLVPCAADGLSYQVRGHLVGRRDVLAGHPDRVTLYLNGFGGTGEALFRFQDVPGYDYAASIAGEGHVSVVIDDLGYGSSGLPTGTQVCEGSQADVAHQIVQALRSGSYAVLAGDSSSPIPFARVILAGASVGGMIAEVAAYSFGDIDGLVVLSWADQSQSPLAALTLTDSSLLSCATGGDPQAGGAGPPGYAHFGRTTSDASANFYYNTDPEVLRIALANRVRDPCGDVIAFPIALALNVANLPRISVPVLLVYGQNDAIFLPTEKQLQALAYIGAKSVTVATIADTGHYLPLERTHLALVDQVNRWLSAHG